jgi:hypothetical protein
MNLAAIRALASPSPGLVGVPDLDPAADALARALRPAYARQRALHDRMADGEIDIDGRSASAVLRVERAGHGGTRWQCAEWMECPADTCPEQGEPVDVEHTWSTGEWWPPDPWPRCHHCGADLAYPKT